MIAWVEKIIKWVKNLFGEEEMEVINTATIKLENDREHALMKGLIQRIQSKAYSRDVQEALGTSDVAQISNQVLAFARQLETYI